MGILQKIPLFQCQIHVHDSLALGAQNHWGWMLDQAVEFLLKQKEIEMTARCTFRCTSTGLLL